MTHQVMDNGVVRDATEEEIAEIEARCADSLDRTKAEAIAKSYRDVDKVTEDAIGRRSEEYKDAAAAARAYAAAGYEGAVDEDISSYAQFNPTGKAQTNQWAADQIIARADAMEAAKKSMRSKRFEHQAAMRAATTAEELAVAVAAWDAFIAATRAELGL